MSKYNERIDRIKSEHNALIQTVHDTITNNKVDFGDEIKHLKQIMEFEEVNVNKYESLIKAQELIQSLTLEVANAKSIEEVTELRKKINHYINVIKAELKKRNIRQDIIDKYMSKATGIRKDMAKYIRYLKRESNIREIERLHSKVDDLTPEELTQFRKLLRREQAYNHRNSQIKTTKKDDFASYLGIDLIPQDQTPDESLSFDEMLDSIKASAPDDVDDTPTFDVTELVTVDDTPAFDMEELVTADNEPDIQEPIVVEAESEDVPEVIEQKNPEFGDVSEFLDSRYEELADHYHVKKTHDYRKKRRGMNLLYFLKNIPAFMHNKKALKQMIDDYNRYYSGSDLESFIEYTLRRNSIGNSLRCIFSSSYLYSSEAEYLNDHEKCAQWIYNFCQNHALDITPVKQFTL